MSFVTVEFYCMVKKNKKYNGSHWKPKLFGYKFLKNLVPADK